MSRKHMAYSILGLGAGDRRGQQKALLVTLVGHAKGIEAYLGQFFADFDGFIVLTSRSDA